MALILIYTAISILSVIVVYKLGRISAETNTENQLDQSMQCIAFLIVMFALMSVANFVFK